MLGSSYRVNNNFEIVDTVQELLGGAATIFQKKGNQAIRSQPMSSVRMKAGSRNPGL